MDRGSSFQGPSIDDGVFLDWDSSSCFEPTMVVARTGGHPSERTTSWSSSLLVFGWFAKESLYQYSCVCVARFWDLDEWSRHGWLVETTHRRALSQQTVRPSDTGTRRSMESVDRSTRIPLLYLEKRDCSVCSVLEWKDNHRRTGGVVLINS